MTPADFYTAYKNLSAVSILPNAGTADFRNLESKRYVINLVDAATKAPPEGSQLEKIYSAVGSVQAAGAAYLANPRAPGPKYFVINPVAFARVMVGKGSPAEMEHVLEVGLACGRIKPTRKDVTEFVDNYFGVDCTGFVCAYFRTIGKMPDVSTNSPDNPVNVGCRYFYDKAKALNQIIWDYNEMRTGDVMVWMLADGTETRKPGHISMIHLRTSANVLYCSESNGSTADGTTDPRMTVRTLGGVVGDAGAPRRHWSLDGDGKVLVLRPFAA